MNKEEKSLFDEIWDAAGLSKDSEPVEAVTAPVEEPIIEEVVEEPVAEEVVAEEVIEEPVAEEVIEEPKEETPQGEAPANPHTTKKKDVKFLVIYTIAFVLVVAALISGSYIISSRLQQGIEDGEGTSQSKLQNIQDKNKALKKENEAVKKQNEQLTASQADADELIESAGDMVEHNEYVASAMEAYIKGNRTTARAILSTVDREKLSPTYQTYYDTLKTRLG